MKILLASPVSTAGLRAATGLRLLGAPETPIQTPAVPLAAELLALGNEVQVVSLSADVPEPLTISEGLLSVTYLPLRSRARDRGLDLFKKEIRTLVQMIRAYDPDIVHGHWTYEYAEAAVRSGKPHLVTMHDVGWGCLRHFRDGYRLMRLVMKYRVMPRIKHLSVVAPYMVNKPRQYGYFGEVSVIGNGITIPTIPPAVTRNDTVNRLRKPVIATIGDTGRLKNVRRSVDAFALIKRQLPDATLHLFGPGLDENFAPEISGVVGHGLTSHDDLMAFLQEKVDLLIHPSLLETFGVIIVEAKARRIPVVAGKKSGGVPWACGDHDAGCKLIDVTDTNAIAAAALGYLLNPDEYLEASCAARRDAADRFSAGKIAQDYIKVYQAILADS